MEENDQIVLDIILGILCLIFLFLVFSESEVYAAETQEEASASQEQNADADEGLLLFGYLGKSEESNVTLARIYNILLTFLYVYIINIGRQVIMRNMRKGQARRGLVE